MLLSDAHRARYQQYYATKTPRVRPHQWQPLVDALVTDLAATSVLDYGCGQEANLARYASYPVENYDPGVPAWAQEPLPADLVVCVHVLEHVEDACLEAVITDMLSLATRAMLLLVSCEPSTKLLPDNTPWHTCVHHGSWWAQLVSATVALYCPEWRRTALPSHLYTATPKEFGCLLVQKDSRHG
jgi:hypothetical protein